MEANSNKIEHHGPPLDSSKAKHNGSPGSGAPRPARRSASTRSTTARLADSSKAKHHGLPDGLHQGGAPRLTVGRQQRGAQWFAGEESTMAALYGSGIGQY
ncbi:hypothetical protein B0A55_02289 [Friedmanniomyces simplex]|uniref:Uncharacterized protein n=1 Tax=Friedmanniomyces simplex TaxID=329884 RepID=A0A4U0XX62_9PEZI|nr:hypothetical protein B0A55_02289 [Friedmanniomyces simplex]